MSSSHTERPIARPIQGDPKRTHDYLRAWMRAREALISGIPVDIDYVISNGNAHYIRAIIRGTNGHPPRDFPERHRAVSIPRYLLTFTSIPNSSSSLISSIFSFSIAAVSADRFNGSTQLMFNTSGWPWFSSINLWRYNKDLNKCPDYIFVEMDGKVDYCNHKLKGVAFVSGCP